MANYWRKKLDELNEQNKSSFNAVTSETSGSSSKSGNSGNYWQTKLDELEARDVNDVIAEKTLSVKRKAASRRVEEEADRIEKRRAELEEKNKKAASKGLTYEKSDTLDKITKRHKSEKEEKEDSSILDLFDEGALAHGYEFSDAVKGALGTVGDLGLSAVKGAARPIENILDLGIYTQGRKFGKLSKAAEFFGQDDVAERMDLTSKIIKKVGSTSAVDYLFEDADKFLDEYSYLGRTSQGVAEGIGQVATMLLTGGIGEAAGLSSAGVSALTTGTTFVSGMGAGMGEAYESGASDGEAMAYGAMSGTAEAITELMFGGLGKSINALGFSKGISSADDMLAKALTNKIKSTWLKNGVETIIKAGGEGVEEVMSGVLQAAAQKLTYMSEEDIMDLIGDQNLLESFLIGALSSAIAQVPSVKQATDAGRDYITGHNKSEQAVIDKATEDAIAEAEKEAEGGKISQREKGKIREKILKLFERGGISTDMIEEVLAGDEYNAWREAETEEEAQLKEYNELADTPGMELSLNQRKRLEELDSMIEGIRSKTKSGEARQKLDKKIGELTKDSPFLRESYAERERRRETFTADVSKYSEAQRDTVQRAIDSGILNNTNKTHDFVDMIAKISADKGVSFGFTNNEKLSESGFAIEGKVVNGYVTKDGVTLNINSSKALNSVVGHEITHVLEGTELYSELQNILFEYAKSKGDYDGRLEDLTELYKDIEGADVNAELTADLAGDYLFTDADFIEHLSVKSRNVFQKIYDEVKYLLKVATAGSKEARQLEKVKRAFDKAWGAQKNTVQADGVKYSLNKNAKTELHKALYDTNYRNEVLLRDNTPPIMLSQKGVKDRQMVMNASHIRENVFTEKEARKLGLKVDTNTHYHGLGEDFFLQVIDGLDNVTEAYRGTPNANMPTRRERYFLLVSEFKDKDGNTINVPVYIEEGAQCNRVYLTANKIATVFGNDDFRKYINDQLRNKNLVRIKNKSNKFSEGGVPLTPAYENTTLNDSIPNSDANVNRKNSLSYEGEQIAPAGNYNVYGKDVALVGDDIAPPVSEATETAGMSEDIAPPVPQKESAVLPGDDIAPPAREDVKAAGNEATSDKQNNDQRINLKYLTEEEKITTAKENFVAKLNNAKAELKKNRENRTAAKKDLDKEIQILEEKLNGLEDKNTKEAHELLGRIEAKKRTQADIDADYEKRINNIEARIGRLRTRIKEIDNRLEERREKLAQKLTTLTIPEGTSDDGGGRVAQSLTSEPGKSKKKRGLWSLVKEYVLDSGMVFEGIAKKANNRQLEADWNSIRYAKSMAQRFLKQGADGTKSKSEATDQNSVKSIVDLEAEVRKAGLTKELYDYLHHKHNVDRMSRESKAQAKIQKILQKNPLLKKLMERYTNAEEMRKDPLFIENSGTLGALVEEIERLKEIKNLPVFGATVTAEISQAAAAQLEKEHPELKEYAEEVYGNLRHLRGMLVDEGIITPELEQIWENMYPHYVPIRRDKKEIVSDKKRKKGTSVSAPLKRAEGGDSDILPLFNSIALRAEQTYRAILKNRFGLNLMNTIKSPGESSVETIDDAFAVVDNNDSLLQEGDAVNNPKFTVFKDGERVTFDITDEMHDAMKPAGAALSYQSKLLRTVNNVFRGLLTEYNPGFLASNAIKDAQDVLINSQHPLETYKNIPIAMKEMATGGKYYKEYLDNGGESNTYFDTESRTFKEDTKLIKKVLGAPFNLISFLNGAVEKWPRLAEYIASRKSGRSIEVSMLDAARVTTNFAAGGRLTKFINRNGGTFLNASFQGAVQQVRNIRETIMNGSTGGDVREAKMNTLRGVVCLAARFAVAGLPFVILNNLHWGDDEEYEDLSDYVKENYYILFKYDGDKFAKLPKGRMVAVIQNAFEQVGDLITGDDEVDLVSFLDLAITNLAPNNVVDNNILSPLVQAHNNKTWYDDDLVPESLQNVPAAEQHDESTDAISKWLGEKINVSPYKINYVLNQYSGVVGDALLPMITPEAEGYSDSFLETLIAPIKDKFTMDSVMDNQNVSDFYDLREELTTNANSKNATDEDILASKYISDVNAEISDLNAQKREIQNSDLSDSEKYYLVREVQKKIIDLTEKAIDVHENVEIDGQYASVGDVEFRWYAPDKDSESEPGWKKLTDEQIKKQNEVTSALGISKREYWENHEAYNFEYEYPEKYKFFTENGISYEDYDNADTATKAAYNWAAKDEDRYDFLKNNGVTLDDPSAFDTEEKKSAWTWAYNNPGKYEVSKFITDDVVEYRKYVSNLNEIKGDKDRNGKTISGSRKDKVEDHINGLDLDYGQKIILFKSLYPSDNTYNNDIVDYLNERDDISRKEMKKILEELDFKVDSRGNISW